MIIEGVNDLATWCRNNNRTILLEEWSYEDNDPLLPNKIACKSNKSVWWVCKKGHRWSAKVSDRNHGNGCPYCSNRKVLSGYNDLLSINPVLAKEWNYKKNNDLLPSDITPNTNRKVWWLCNAGHEWEASVSSRNRGNGCPFCAGQRAIIGINDLGTVAPELLSEWNYKRNENIKPIDVCGFSNKKVWWVCKKNHEWQTTVANRRRGDKCPYCSNKKVLSGFNDLFTVRPDVAMEWNYEKNGELIPQAVLPGIAKKVWWKCDKGHEWQATINSRTNMNAGCPRCSYTGSSKPEQGIAFYLSKCCDIEQRKKINQYEIDIFIQKFGIGIEYDGVYYHRNKKSLENQKNTAMRNENINLIRIKESDHNSVEGTVIYYIQDNMGPNYEWAIRSLFDLLSNILGSEIFRAIDINIRRDSVEIREQFALTQRKNSLGEKEPLLVKEWNSEKNGLLTPYMFPAYSNDLVWWRCPIGHEWKAQINSRTRGNGCPYCSGLKTLPGFNDFETWCRNNNKEILLEEWDYSQNTVATNLISPHNDAKVWWGCKKGHKWMASIGERTCGAGCPYCSNHRVLKGYNDLATTNPNLAEEWDYSKNVGLKNKKGVDISEPCKVTITSGQIVWWKCKKCGCSWKAVISSRGGKQKTGCPVCAGRKVLQGVNDIFSQKPELLKEWNWEKNTDISPKEVTVNSSIKVWWKCLCGHAWETSISNRSSGKGCPFCSGVSVLSGFNDLKTHNPELAEEWNYSKNEGLMNKNGVDISSPDKVFPNSNLSVWWKCKRGHEWKAIIANRNKGIGCPICANDRKGKRVINIDSNTIYASITDAAHKTGIDNNSISLCCKGKLKTAGGYHWKYIQ